MKKMLLLGKMVVVYALLAFAGTVPVVLAAKLLMAPPALNLSLYIVTLVAMPALFLPHFFKIPLKQALPLGRPARDLDLIIVIMTVGFLLSGQLLQLLPGTRSPESLLTDYTVPLLALMGVLSKVVLSPIAEELLFRGALWTVAGRMCSPTTVWLLTSALFMLSHADRGLASLPYFLAGGLWLGWLRLESGSLTFPILAHTAFNGSYELLTSLELWPQPEMAAVSGLTILALGLMLIRYRSRSNRPSASGQPS